MRDDHPNDDRAQSRRDLIRAGLSAALVAALPASVRARTITSHASPNAPDLRYLDAAMAAARWLRATAIASPTGTTWPAVPPDAKTEQRDLYTGYPGVLLFLVELHHATGDRAWLDLATSGADSLAASLPDAATGDDGAGLYSGLAGVAYTLEEVGRARGDTRY